MATQDGTNPCSRLTAPMYLQLLTDVVNVVLDRGRLDSQLPADFLVRQAAIHEMRNLQLPT
jgi:hypothetical protein